MLDHRYSGLPLILVGLGQLVDGEWLVKASIVDRVHQLSPGTTRRTLDHTPLLGAPACCLYVEGEAALTAGGYRSLIFSGLLDDPLSLRLRARMAARFLQSD